MLLLFQKMDFLLPGDSDLRLVVSNDSGVNYKPNFKPKSDIEAGKGRHSELLSCLFPDFAGRSNRQGCRSCKEAGLHWILCLGGGR